MKKVEFTAFHVVAQWEKRKEKMGSHTFLLQDSAPTAPPYVVLHIAGVVGQVGLLDCIKQ